MLVSSAEGESEEKLSFNPRRMHRDSMVFFDYAGILKLGL